MSSSLRRPTAILAAIALLTGLAACSSSDTADEKHQLTVGLVVDPSWSHVPVAQSADYFKQQGLDVKIVNFSTGVEALQALTAGQVDVTTAAAVPTSAAAIKSTHLRVVADGARWKGFRIVARKASGITTLADLAGKKIGTPLGTSGAFAASTVLGDAGVKAELVQVAPPAIVTALSQGDVDAVAIFEPFQTQVIKALGDEAVVLKGPKQFVDHCLYLSTDTTITNKNGDLKRFFAALGEASTDLSKPSGTAVTAVADATKLDRSLVASVLSEYDYTLQLPASLAKELRALGTWAKTVGNIPAGSKLPDYARFLDPQFVR